MAYYYTVLVYAGEVVDAAVGGDEDGVDETGVDIIDALDIFLLGAAPPDESKDFTEKEIRTREGGGRSSSPAAELLAARGTTTYPYVSGIFIFLWQL